MGSSSQHIADLLDVAAAAIKDAPGIDPWQHGWCVSEYRNSGKAALPSSGGPVTMTTEGISAYEQAVAAFLKQAPARDRWDAEELWGLVASLVVAASESKNPRHFIDLNILKVLKPSPALVAFPVANVEWGDEPRLLGNKCVIGKAGTRFSELVVQMGGRAASAEEIVTQFIDRQPHRPKPVCFATLVPGQRSLGFKEASRRFELLVDTALLLDMEKERHGLHSSRGSWNRPGVRGLTLDRRAIEQSMQRKDTAVELYSNPLIYDEVGHSGGNHWYSADPVPFHEVLSHVELSDAVVNTLFDAGTVYRRIGVASKWFAESFWASNADDATLALGVALDALIGSKAGLPGRAMKERFALLDHDPQSRPARAKRYDELYAVRSRIAHGGLSSKVEEEGFVKGFQREVAWAAWRLIAMHADFSISGDSDLESTLENLRWGTVRWPSGGRGERVSEILRSKEEAALPPSDVSPCGKALGVDE
ncbi:hypothetical protein [Streptomyces sp. NPDC058202]|uniref:hypothetical protein n=1 Tax=Streptomyces sp. NPDC058202 TaxID=3346380 RepID=UPI0036E95287